MVDHCTHKRREPESQEMPNSLVVPCCECVPLPQSVESSFDRVPLNVRSLVLSPRILYFVPERMFKPLLLGHPKEDRLTAEDTHFAVRRSSRPPQSDVTLLSTLTARARLHSYSKQMWAGN